MIRRDRFLLSILAGIILLVLLALALFLARRGPPAYTTDESPLGVVQNYALAISIKDYDRAFGYIAGPPGVQIEKVTANSPAGLPDLDHFRQFFMIEAGNQLANTGMEIGAVQSQIDNTALVAVTLLHTSGGVFDSVGRETQMVQLVRQNGAWKIAGAPYPFWNYSWPSSSQLREKFAPAVPAPVGP
jgi:hypothetical protein